MAILTSRRMAWEWISQPGLEYLILDEVSAGIRAVGWIVATLDGKVVTLHYTVECAAGWRFQQLQLDLEATGVGLRRLSIRLDPQGNWFIDGRPCPDLAGCSYIDIMVTPFTNTLPIRNLELKVNQSESIRVAYIRFPELNVSPVDQEYTRLDPGEPPRRFRYHNLSSGYTAELDVDRDGLVVNYPGIWRQIGL
jgi:hypothetical protein